MTTEAQGYEVAPYSDTEFGPYEAFKVLKQSIVDLVRDSPAHSVRADWVGDKVRVTFQSFVALYPIHRNQVDTEANEVQKQTVSYLKKEFKARTKKTLKLKEVKELGDYSVQKTSLNERYIYTCWRFYEISWS
jgi:hypothetical protein